MSYWGLHFWGVIQAFFQMFLSLATGERSIDGLAIDEIQLIVLLLIGISCALIGCFLLLRKMTMLANSISHTILVGIVIAHLIFQWFYIDASQQVLTIDMGVLLLASLIASLLTLFLTDLMNRTLKLQKDASVGLVFTFLFAIGIVLVTIFTKNSHIGSEIIMGNIDLVHYGDIKMAFFLCVGNIFLISLFFKEYLITAFDEGFAKLSRISNWAFTYLLLLQTSATVIASLRAVGVVLVLAFIVAPPLIARLYTKRLKPMLLLSCLIAICTAFITVALSRHLLSVYSMPLSTAGLAVALQFALWIGSVVVVYFIPQRAWRGEKTKREELLQN